MTAKTRKSAKAQIAATVKEVRETIAEAHADRMDACTKAAEAVVITDEGQVLDTAAVEPKVTKLPVGAKGLGQGGKAKGAKVLRLTSPAKMGRARGAKGKVAAAEAKVRAKSTARQATGMWAGLRSIDAATAQKYADMLGDWTTARAAERETGLDAKERMKVEAAMTRNGFTFTREVNPDAVAGDRLTRFRYRAEAPAG